MASTIDQTKPTSGTALTSDVRSNFGNAKTEIESSLRLHKDAATAGGTYNVLTATYAPSPTLADKIRVLLKVPDLDSASGGTGNTAESTLSVGGGAAKTIKRQDGSAIVDGQIKKGMYLDLVYDGTNWIWLDSVSSVVVEDIKIITLKALYPTQSIYITANPAHNTAGNVATFFGFGTWVAHGEGRILVGVGNNGTNTYAFGAGTGTTGGNDNVSLTAANMVEHRHLITKGGIDVDGDAGNGLTSTVPISTTGDFSGDNRYAYTLLSGGAHEPDKGRSGKAVNVDGNSVAASPVDNRSAFQVVYMWRRTL